MWHGAQPFQRRPLFPGVFPLSFSLVYAIVRARIVHAWARVKPKGRKAENEIRAPIITGERRGGVGRGRSALHE